MYKVANGMPLEIMNDIFRLRENIHDNLRHTLQFLVIQFTVCLMVVNQHRMWDPKFGNKYPWKVKILTPLLVLKRN